MPPAPWSSARPERLRRPVRDPPGRSTARALRPRSGPAGPHAGQAAGPRAGCARRPGPAPGRAARPTAPASPGRRPAARPSATPGRDSAGQPSPSTIPKITWPTNESVTVVGVSGNISCWPRGRSTVAISPPQVGPTAKSTAAATVTRRAEPAQPRRRRPDEEDHPQPAAVPGVAPHVAGDPAEHPRRRVHVDQPRAHRGDEVAPPAQEGHGVEAEDVVDRRREDPPAQSLEHEAVLGHRHEDAEHEHAPAPSG